MLKKIVVLICLISSPLYGVTFKLDERDLFELVQTRNGRVKGGEAELLASQAELGHLRRSFLPRFRVDVGNESTDGGRNRRNNNTYAYSTASASINMFNGGRDSLQEKIRQASVFRSETELESAKFDLLTQARVLFWQMIYQKEIINILISSLELNEKNLQSALKKIRSNLATKTDEIDFNQTKIQLTQDLQKAKIILINNMRLMASYLNQSLDTVYDIPELNVHEANHELDDFKDREFKAEMHREVRRFDALGAFAESESELSSRWWTPQFDLYASTSNRFETIQLRNEMDIDQGKVLGLKLTFSFDGFESRATSVAQNYRAMSFSYFKKQRLLEIESDYANSYQLFVLNHDLVHSAEENNIVAQKYYENVWSEYMRGIKNSPDVLQAFLRTVEAKLRYADIKKDYQVAKAQILGFLQE